MKKKIHYNLLIVPNFKALNNRDGEFGSLFCNIDVWLFLPCGRRDRTHRHRWLVLVLVESKRAALCLRFYSRDVFMHLIKRLLWFLYRRWALASLRVLVVGALFSKRCSHVIIVHLFKRLWKTFASLQICSVFASFGSRSYVSKGQTNVNVPVIISFIAVRSVV